VELEPSKFTNRVIESEMTPTEVAAKAGVSTATVNRCARGDGVSRVAARNIARVLRVPLKELVSAE
jgi:DNA-binding XRE family transcriptional regulator